MIRTRSFFKNLWHFVRLIYRCYDQEGCSYRAASLAYTTLLSLVPLLSISFTVLSFFPKFQLIAGHIQDWLFRHFVASSAHTISVQLELLLTRTNYLSSLNVSFLGLGAILLVYHINRMFNAIWHVEQRFHVSVYFLIYSLVLLVLPFFLVGTLLLGTFLLKLPVMAELLGIDYVKKPLLILFPYLLIFMTFTTFNWVLPACRVKLSHAVVGGAITTVLFELSKYLFSLYFKYFPTYQVLYGALATIPIFLVWLYVAWTIVLLGVIITYLLDTKKINIALFKSRPIKF